MVRQTSELETNVVAVERTKEYCDTPNEVNGSHGLAINNDNCGMWTVEEVLTV